VGTQIFLAAITNQQIFGLIPQSQIRKFIRGASPNIGNLQGFYDYSANRKTANSKSATFSP
jgi:hypothetical protein